MAREDSATGGSHRRWTGLEKFLAVAAAAFTLATAVLTLITTEVNSDRQQARSSAVTAGSDLTSLQSRYNALQAQNSRLESQNQEYRSRLASTTPATSQPPPGGAGAQLGTYHFDLIGGREVPLGADPPTQAQVLAGNQGDIMWRSDLGGEPLFPGTSEQIVLLSPGAIPTYQACGTGEHIVASVSQPVVGTAFCVLENTASVAGVRITAVNTTTAPGFVTLQVTTWRDQVS
jgi:hypothetical protein